MDETTWREVTRMAEAEIAAVMAELPDAVRRRLTDLPVTVERKPNPEMVRAGLQPDRTLGLFTGVAYPNAIAISQRLPPHIILFLENLWDYAEHNPAAFREQVRLTLLHEIGHYLGLDERGVRSRGL